MPCSCPTETQFVRFNIIHDIRLYPQRDHGGCAARLPCHGHESSRATVRDFCRCLHDRPPVGSGRGWEHGAGERITEHNLDHQSGPQSGRSSEQSRLSPWTRLPRMILTAVKPLLTRFFQRLKPTLDNYTMCCLARRTNAADEQDWSERIRRRQRPKSTLLRFQPRRHSGSERQLR